MGAKTSLDGTLVKWSAGDALSLYNTNSTKKVFTLVSGAGTTSGQFSGDKPNEASPYYVIYPNNAANTKANGLNFVVAQNQIYAANSFGNGAFPMYGTFGAFSDPIEMKNLFGGIKLQFTGECTVNKIVLEDLAAKSLWGMAKLALNGKQGTDAQTITFTDGGSSINLICADGVALNKTTPTAFYFAVPAGSFSAGFRATVYSGSTVVGSFTTTADKTISRNNIRVMASLEVTGTGGGPTDLSLLESANCYILYDGGQYKFKAVKGNGTDKLTVTSVEVLWETVNTATAPAVGAIVKNPSYANDYITFTATGTPGNALIAAKNGSTIVWSWHIWVPSSKVTKAAYSNGKVAAVMDRNLGALVETAGSPLSNGLMYQFGRKDPFMGSTEYSTKNVQAASTGTFTSEKVTSSTIMDYVIAHPMTDFMYDKNVVSNGDWLYGTNGSRYNWLLEASASAAVKTVNDPCPPGYRVAPKDAWDNLPTPSYSNYTWTIDGKHTYPFNGTIYGSDAKIHGCASLGYVWTRNAGANQGTFVYLTTTAVTPNKTADRSGGYGVRCSSDTAPAN